MSAKNFLDTNILIYAWNHQVPEKQRVAGDLLKEGRAMISWQVIQEFCNVALIKFEPAMPVSDLEHYVVGYLEPLCAVCPTRALWSRALGLHTRTQYGYYDALIVAAALTSGSGILYSEDLQHGRNIQGMEIRNPFLVSA